jgi:hypothetical protein
MQLDVDPRDLTSGHVDGDRSSQVSDLLAVNPERPLCYLDVA